MVIRLVVPENAPANVAPAANVNVCEVPIVNVPVIPVVVILFSEKLALSVQLPVEAALRTRSLPVPATAPPVQAACAPVDVTQKAPVVVFQVTVPASVQPYKVLALADIEQIRKNKIASRSFLILESLKLNSNYRKYMN
jgi:hypothetical protein